MKVSIKKHLKRIIFNLGIMLITYIVLSLIIHHGIDWFNIMLIVLSYFVFYLISSYQEEKGRSDI